MKWDFAPDRAIYVQIVEQMRLFILSGQIACGQKLPSVRELAEDAGVNPNTMQKALSELERSGLVYTNRTSGRFVTEESDLIEYAKNALAKEKISDFLLQMKNIGISPTETLRLIKEYNEE